MLLKPTLSSVSTRNHVSSFNFLIATIFLGTVFLKNVSSTIENVFTESCIAYVKKHAEALPSRLNSFLYLRLFGQNSVPIW